MTNTANLEARAMFLEGVHSKLLESSNAERAWEVSEIVAQKRRMDGLVELNNRRVQRNQDYAALLRITIFFFLLSSMVMVQRNAGDTFMATAPIVRTIQGDLDSEAFTISGPSEIYDFVENFAGSVLEDSKCGDGVCDQNEYEYPGFGRFGCQEDCGKYSKTSLITVQLDDFLAVSKNYNQKATNPSDTWDLSNIARSYSPDYKWNIYSYTMGAFIFEEHQNVTGYKAVVEVPDGKLELRLFQVQATRTHVYKHMHTRVHTQGGRGRNEQIPARTLASRPWLHVAISSAVACFISSAWNAGQPMPPFAAPPTFLYLVLPLSPSAFASH